MTAPSEGLEPRTRMFARVLGPFLVGLTVAVAIRTPDVEEFVSEFTASAVWPWVLGALALLGGVSIVALHQSWRSPAAVVISVFGWLLVVRGLILLFFPAVVDDVAARMLGSVTYWLPAVAVLGVLGLYLSYVGWRPVTTVAPTHISTER